MKIKVNDYVRTKEGYICKILKLNEPRYDDGYLDFNDINSPKIYKPNIVKASPQIIDLIEVGDVIRAFSDLHDLLGNELFEIRDEQHLKHLKNGFNKGYFHLISIVTKEQFEQMEYKID